MPLLARACALSLTVTLLACQSVYYDTLERFGTEKRDILRDRVEAGRDDQQAAEEQFLSAYERFKAVSGYDGGDLESVYDDLSTELARSEEKAEAVRDRIQSIDRVAADLFDEWQREIELMQSPDLRRSSESSLRDTRRRYQQLIDAMRRAESKMDPVLAAFRDQVLFLKHNLNARAIRALEGNVVAIEDDVAALIADIQVSIREAERFIGSLED